MISYPSHLRSPQLLDLSLNPVDPLERFELASGRSVSVLEHDEIPEYAPVRYVFDQQQYRDFVGWHRWRLGYGQHWFEGPIKTALGVEKRRCRFRKMYQARPLSHRHWSVTAELELEFHATPSYDETFGTLEGISLSDFVDAFGDALNNWYADR